MEQQHLVERVHGAGVVVPGKYFLQHSPKSFEIVAAAEHGSAAHGAVYGILASVVEQTRTPEVYRGGCAHGIGHGSVAPQRVYVVLGRDAVVDVRHGSVDECGESCGPQE